MNYRYLSDYSSNGLRFNGRLIDFDRPETLGELTIQEVLAKLNSIRRFNGEGRLTVTQHSMFCEALAHYYCPEDLSEADALHIRMHDIAEAFTGDVPSPMKTDAQREHEKHVYAVLMKHFFPTLPEPTAFCLALLKLVDTTSFLLEFYFPSIVEELREHRVMYFINNWKSDLLVFNFDKAEFFLMLNGKEFLFPKTSPLHILPAEVGTEPTLTYSPERSYLTLAERVSHVERS